jgi:hypothetical protein
MDSGKQPEVAEKCPFAHQPAESAELDTRQFLVRDLPHGKLGPTMNTAI